eukprot:CAMPEP_0198352188 /NCGR_PEP_ID=MMETSP1450-20131203/106117_1 /TAXON_ID=753684 ORGANISM="Madagascaria erythrocladiodes, Strain CCMP3234" /NCGR_SAMPLE_ID=MMETSP1450 /ASSEMBLY_ACC=CAM_ASM_001115 /LENGTH=113 /DNA_ID=CAMNT_0044058201 /DNA_START=45 /DNA_END=383 /DNA_ORIENTATION=+
MAPATVASVKAYFKLPSVVSTEGPAVGRVRVQFRRAIDSGFHTPHEFSVAELDKWVTTSISPNFAGAVQARLDVCGCDVPVTQCEADCDTHTFISEFKVVGCAPSCSAPAIST